MYSITDYIDIIAKKKERLIIGLMSGTSLDGLDAALVRFSENQPELIAFYTYPFSDKMEMILRGITSQEVISNRQLTRAHKELSLFSAECIKSLMDRSQYCYDELDAIGTHGHTLYHIPGNEEKNTATFQIGDGDILSVETAVPVISDFRQKSIAHGDEGAPLAIYGDMAWFWSDEITRVSLNLGGMANITILPKNKKYMQVVTTDTGPANKLIDLVTKEFFGLPFDKNGELASKGLISDTLLSELLNDDFFKKPFPKSTGAEYFNLSWLNSKSALSKFNKYDLLATITELTAVSIANAVNHLLSNEQIELIISGGGVHNSRLWLRIEHYLPKAVLLKSDQLGIDADAKEAMLFAYLADCFICGKTLPNSKGKPMYLGKLSLPI